MNGIKEAVLRKQRSEKEREKESFARVGISNVGLQRTARAPRPARTFVRNFY